MNRKRRLRATALFAIALAILAVVYFVDGEKAPPPKQAALATEKTTAEAARIREPAVAGLFYPKEPAELSRLLDRLLTQAPTNSLPELKALVCPHAGYIYSGLTAAFGYKTAAGHEFRTIIILAPSHYAAFKGASIPAVEAYRTPLGLARISPKAKKLASVAPFGFEPRCFVERPAWWPQSSRSAPAAGEDTPDTWEHSAEVQVPFLQRVLTNFTILPIVFGEVDPEQAARGIAEQLDEKTLIVASSDLSHYHPYEEAQRLDQQCIKAVCDLDIGQMQAQEACGKVPILTLMHLAKQKGWKARLLDCRNSGDTSGEKNRVVGYAAIAFYAPKQEAYAAGEKKLLMDLARQTVREVVARNRLPTVNENTFPKKFNEPKGCFVTLTTNGVLRGCIGHILPQMPLYRAIMENAQSAAMRDPRFSSVRTDELNRIEIEISILTEPQPLSFKSPEELLQQLVPNRDGVVLRIGAGGATYLPQVWSQLPDKVTFLNELSQKAGFEPTAWRRPGTAVFVYRVESFKEGDL
jgi:AmmeMemoRadiSam system protein A